jgi:hypothetical protein
MRRRDFIQQSIGCFNFVLSFGADNPQEPAHYCTVMFLEKVLATI